MARPRISPRLTRSSARRLDVSTNDATRTREETVSDDARRVIAANLARALRARGRTT